MESVTQSETFYKLWAWLDAHKKHVLSAAIIVVALGVGVGFFLWRQGARESTANDALSRAVSGEMVSGQQGQSGDAVLRITTEYAGTDAAERGLLLAGADLFMQGKYPEAQAQFEKYLREHRDGPFAGQARFAIAACLDASGKTDSAIAAYSEIVNHPSTENVVPQARLALGRLSEAQGKLEQARDYYARVMQNERGTIASEAYMRLQALITKHPELVPAKPPPSTTNAPALNITSPQ